MTHYWDEHVATQVNTLTHALPHALLLTGERGVGLKTLAAYLADNHLAGVIEPTDAKGEIDTSPSGIVRVTQIRELTDQAAGKSRDERVFIIDNADQMNHQAQNAFLKLLEEPAQHVHFILTAHAPENLLPTVQSRTQQLRIPTINQTQTNQLLDTMGVHDDTMRAQLRFLADGLPAELMRLIADETSFRAKAAVVTDARRFLQGETIDKLAVINEYSSDRPKALQLLSFAQRIITRSVSQKPSGALIAKADELATVYDRIAANGHIKIQLMSLVV